MKTRSFIFRVVSIAGVLVLLSGCGTNSPTLPAATCDACGVVANDVSGGTTPGGVFIGGGHAVTDSATTKDGESRDGVFMGGGH